MEYKGHIRKRQVTDMGLSERGACKKSKQELEESTSKYHDLLRQSIAQKEELETIFDALPLQSWYKDKNNRIIKVNKAFADYMHMSKKDLEGKPLCDLFSPDIAQKCWEEDKEVIETGKPKREIIDRHETPNGVNWFLTQKLPYKDKTGNAIGTISFSLDITQHKKAEDALRSSEEKYRIYVEGSPVAFFVINSERKYVEVNDKACNLLGYSKEELLGMTTADVIFKEDFALAIEQRYMLEETGKSVVEFRLKRKDGQPVYVILNTVKLTNGKSMAFCENITERKRLEKQLQDKERWAAIGATAGMVGHDIRNPLQAIAGDLYLIDNDVGSLPEGEIKKSLQESASAIHGNLIYIAKIVEDLQDYAKQQKPNLEKIEIDKAIGDVMQLITISPNHQVIIDIQKNFPQFLADFSMLKRVLSNIVNNAVQAMPNGGQLTIKVYHDDNHAFFSVKDTGVGIPQEVKHRLFEPMVTTKAKGQGLGLAVAKRLVETQGGTISFESQEGKGTTFTIRLPLKK